MTTKLFTTEVVMMESEEYMNRKSKKQEAEIAEVSIFTTTIIITIRELATQGEDTNLA